MKSYLYVVLPAVAILLIFMNMMFGHELFASSTEQVINKYSIYVHLLPEWKESKNIIFDITNSWYQSEKIKSNTEDKINSHNYNQLQSLNGKTYVELKHAFSDCSDEWKPILYRKAIDTVRHEIEYLQGTQLSDDPSIAIYQNIKNPMYSNLEQENKINGAYAQFIPICTSKNITSYDYSIKTDNDSIGFDVYFVRSIQERSDLFSNQTFDYYDGKDCFGKNKQSYSGTCRNISKDSGLLVIIPDELKPWVTKITINLYEVE
jgi:hypothetical protein